MIPKKLRAGTRTVGLLYYLYGRGRANEHTDPHLVAAWAMGVRDPARDPGVTMAYLAGLLDAPVLALPARRRPAQHVYHLGIRVAPQDRRLSDQEWADIAREMVDASGLAPAGDPMGARWVAVRHADDHVHVVATMARQDGKIPNVRRDMPKMQARARELERRYGLRQLVSGDRTAREWLTRAELEKAERAERPAPARTELGRVVRQAAASAGSEEEFFDAVRAAGVRVRLRYGQAGEVTGYAVAAVGDRTGEGKAVWYGGARLAPDLSLPRVRERWTGLAQPAVTTGAAQPAAVVTGPVDRAQVWRSAAGHVYAAAARLGQAGDSAAAGEMVALSDLLTVLGADAPPVVHAQLRQAAAAFERAGRTPTTRTLEGPALRELRAATTLLVRAGRAAGWGADPAVLMLVMAMLLVVAAATRWHQQHGHLMQQEAAALAGRHLHAAVEMTSGARIRTERRAAGPIPQPVPVTAVMTQDAQRTVRQVLPLHADRIVAEAAWPALVASLATVRNAGDDPGVALTRAVGRRSLDDAQSVSEVLVWRLARQLQTTATGGLPDSSPAHPQAAHRHQRLVAGDAAAVVPRQCGADGQAPTLADVVRQAVPEHAAAILADPAAAALAGALGAVRARGHDAAAVLADVTAARSLDDAESVAQVLTWRMQGLLHRQPGPVTNPAHPGDAGQDLADAVLGAVHRPDGHGPEQGHATGLAADLDHEETDEDLPTLDDGHGQGHSP